MKKAFLASLLALSLFSVSCSSKKPANQGVAGNAPGNQEGANIQLNGDSDSGKAGGLETVHFPLDSHSLSEAGKRILKNNANYLKQYPKVTLQIEGHCDERGSRQYNLALGERRAKVIKDYLNALGVKSFRMTTISFGNEKPLEEGSGEASWSKNRRGNFVITSL